MNRTTKAQRDEWIAAARQLINLDTDGKCLNSEIVVFLLRKRHNISLASARNAPTHAILLTRGERLKKR